MRFSTAEDQHWERNKSAGELTNGQAERMVRTIKEATVRSFHDASIAELRRHVRDWLAAYNCAKQLKALSFKTPTRQSSSSGKPNRTSSTRSHTITPWD